jgi:hypothetical protein
MVDLAPFWSGGELAPILHEKSRLSENSIDLILDQTIKEKFKYKDVFVHSRFGSLKKALGVYGFIFGRKAIEYLKRHNKTTIKWKFRIYYKKF